MSRERLCPFAERYPQPPQPLSAPFGPGVSALFRLLNPDDSYNDSHYILHGTLILAVRLSQALSLSTLSREFPTRALPPTQVTVGLPQMDRAAVYSNYALVDTVTTGTDGRVFVTLEAGSYYAVETKCPSGFKLDSTPHYFEVVTGKTTPPLVVTNKAFSGILIHLRHEVA